MIGAGKAKLLRGLPAILALGLFFAPAEAASDAAACLQCHDKLGAKKPVADHATFSGGGCFDCHAIDPAGPASVCGGAEGKRWRTELQAGRGCLECHRDADQLKADAPKTAKLHSGVGGALCLGCHSPHGTDQPAAVLKEGSPLCLTCHGPDARSPAKVRIDKKAPGTHKVLKKVDCQDCHEAGHASAFPKMLPKPVGEGCVECHDAPVAKVLHTPAKNGQCTGCHDPHASPNALLLRAEGKALCLRCHSVDSPEGEGAAGPKFRLDLKRPGVHKALRKMDCQDCHVSGHGGDVEGLIQKAVPALCYDCHDPVGEKTSVHEPVKKGECSKCHDPHVGEDGALLRKRADELCFDCHPPEKLVPQHVGHAPVLEGQCVRCHEAHASDNKKLLKGTGNAFCKGCHDAAGAPFEGMPRPSGRITWKKKVNHKAIGQEGCKGCHVEGHGGEQPKLLNKPPAELCAECHDTPEAQRYTHGALKNGDCAVCHDPHTSDLPNLLRKEKSAELCFLCHQDDVTGRKVTHKPVAEGKCDECHDPHGSPYPFSLINGKGAQVCRACHDAVDQGRNKHKALTRAGCTGCHDAHGGPNEFLLVKKTNDLCRSCHEKFGDGAHVTSLAAAGHPISGVPDPRHKERELTCASCHDPHSSSSPKLLRFGEDAMESCSSCHGDKTGKHPEMKDLTRRPVPPTPFAAPDFVPPPGSTAAATPTGSP